jgi:hypothetical protein
MKKNIKVFLKEIFFLNKKYKTPKDIRKNLKLMHPKDSIPSAKVYLSFLII